MKKPVILSALIVTMLVLSACGQKGPLIVEQPTIEIPKTQDKELAPTR